jgi:hypothetical protein
MGALGIALLLGLGGGAWVYSRFYSRTGGNSKSSLITGALCGGAIALVSFIILSFII